MDLTRFHQLTEAPPLFEPGETLFWDDPHISAQMLAAHLDPNTNAASRVPETINHIVGGALVIAGLVAVEMHTVCHPDIGHLLRRKLPHH